MLDAEVLLCHVLRVSRTHVLSHPEQMVDASAAEAFTGAVERRASGVPVAQITGTKEFYGRMFHVTPDVLVPRPDTETLIDVARSYLRNHPATRIADIGTGSGNIGITLLLEYPSLYADLVDCSHAALDVARTNAARNGVIERCAFWCADGLETLTKTDLIVSNPPYLDPTWVRDPSTQHEPDTALYADKGGLAIIEQLIRDSKDTPLIIEFDPRQAEKMIASARTHQKHAQLFRDLSGHERVAVITLREQAPE